MGAQMIITVLGGLGLFILGMDMMSQGLQQAAGDRLRRVLEYLTFNRLVAVFTGIIITALIQSSSATTVMVVGFVNAGLMSLHRAVGIILGANIGTTVTGQIVALDITAAALPAIALGVVMVLFVKRRVYNNLGRGILGFGLLFLGISIMGSELSSLRDIPGVVDLLAKFGQYRLLGVVAGALFTGIIQSSSATTAIVIVLAGRGLLNLDAAMAMVLGANIGTCITALLASIGTGLNARRAAMAHLIFNVTGAVIFFFFLTPFTGLIRTITGRLASQVAWGHTLFNVVNTLLFLPFLPAFVKLITKIVPGQEVVREAGPTYLDRNLLKTPSLALGAAERELGRMADLALEMVDDTMHMLVKNDLGILRKIARKEDVVDELEKDIAVYLSEMSQYGLTLEQSRLVASYLHAVNDIERIGDHADNIAALLQEKIERGYPFSESAVEELKEMHSKVRNMVARAVAAFRSKNLALAREIIAEDTDVDRMEKNLRQRHVSRINEGRCFPPSGVLYLDIISNLERIGDHSVNIAQIVLGDF